VLFTTRVFSTGVGTNADSLPSGTLYLNGTANGATVTVTNISTGLYKAAVTLPTLAVNDEVEIIIAATVSTIADTAVIWGDTKDFFAGCIPDVAAGAANGLPLGVDASGRVDVLKVNGTNQTAVDLGARLGAPAGASMSADIAAIKSDTGTILTDVNTGAGAIYTRLGAPAGASIAADIAQVETHAASADTQATASAVSAASADNKASTILTNLAAVPAAIFAAVSEGAETFIQTIRIIRSGVAGKLNGAPSGPINTRDLADTKNRISATIDANNNRTAVTTDGT
jgi:hypothetical protein